MRQAALLSWCSSPLLHASQPPASAGCRVPPAAACGSLLSPPEGAAAALPGCSCTITVFSMSSSLS